MDNIKIAPSILSADFWRLGEEIKKVEKAGADLLHIDVMDGHFAPNISIGIPVVKSIKRKTDLPLNTHLMIYNPEKYIKAFKEAGADTIIIHPEASSSWPDILVDIKKLGAKAGISINPKTSPNILKDHLDKIDYVLLMTVHPGFGGQKYLKGSAQKIKQTREIIKDIDLGVDGGVNTDNILEIIDAGANIIISGNTIFKSENPEEVIKKLRNPGGAKP
jgi:ribulose-phosphate 3-epimerase